MVLQKEEEAIKIIVDNAVIHLSKRTQQSVRKLNLHMYCLTPYSPSLAPVELVFAMTKSILRKEKSSKWVDFGKNNGKLEIVESLKGLDTSTGKKMWRKALSFANLIILECAKALDLHPASIEDDASA